MKRVPGVVLVAAAILVVPTLTDSWEWPADGIPIAAGPDDQRVPRIAGAGDGRTYVAWLDDDPDSGRCTVQLLDPLGAPAWAPPGVRVGSDTVVVVLMSLLPDSSGNALVVWRESSPGMNALRAQKLDSGGIAQWGPEGVLLTTRPPAEIPAFDAMDDGGGGLLVSWRVIPGPTSEVRAQRLDAAGLPAWAPEGALVCPETPLQGTPQIVPTGTGGAIVAWTDRRNPTPALYGQHLDNAGMPLWEGTGRDLGAPEVLVTLLDMLGRGPSFQVLFSTQSPPDTFEVMLRTLDGDGLTMWSRSTARYGGPGAVSPLVGRLLSDGRGGTLLTAWLGVPGAREIRVNRVAPDGAPLWGAEGQTVARPSLPTQSTGSPAADGLGGAWFAWSDSVHAGTGQDVFIQRLNGEGDASWPSGGAVVCAATGRQTTPVLAAEVPRDAVVAWSDQRGGDRDVYAQRVRLPLPEPPLCKAPPVLYVPDGGLPYTVHVEGVAGPIAGALVEIAFTPEADAAVCWCGDQPHPLIAAWTDSLGDAVFRIRAGQCVDPAGFSGPPVLIFADGVLIGETGGVSPDIVEYVAPCTVEPADGILFTPMCRAGDYGFCYDLDGDGRVGLIDGAIAQMPLAVQSGCADSAAGPWYGYELPGENADVSIALHLSVTSPPVDCGDSPCLTNRSLVTSGELDTGYMVYVVACDASGTAGLRGAEFGLEYGPAVILEGGFEGNCGGACGTGMTFQSGIGLAFLGTYSQCLDIPPHPEDENALNRVLGAFYVYAYAPSTMEIMPHPVTGEVTIMECGGTVLDLPDHGQGRLGRVGFGLPGTNPSRLADDRPWCEDDVLTVPEDVPGIVHVLDNDFYPCRSRLDVLSVSPSDEGAAPVVQSMSVVFTPPENYHGPDRFTYVAGNPWGGVDSASVWVTVTPVNDPPAARDDTLATFEDDPVTLNPLVNDADVDGDDVQLTGIDSTGTSGSVTLIPGTHTLLYAPEPGFRGEDRFHYSVGDGHGGTGVGGVTVTVLPGAATTTCDPMTGDLWTFFQSNPGTSCSWHALYATSVHHSAPRAVDTYIGYGGGDGQDFGGSYARRDFAFDGPIAPDSIAVWFRIQAMTPGSYTYRGFATVQVIARDAAEATLDQQVYCVAVDDDLGYLLHDPTWIYQESRPATYEPGAPWYQREPDDELRPPPGWWYKLTVRPGDALTVDWAAVRSLRIELTAGGAYLYEDAIGVAWDDLCIHGGSALGVGPPDGGPAASVLEQNVPNPFRGGTSIPVEIAGEAFVRVEVFDLSGRRVRTLVSATLPAGRYAFPWSGRDEHDRPLSPGIYFVRLGAGETVATRKALLLP